MATTSEFSMDFGNLPTDIVSISRDGLWYEDFNIPDKSAEWIFEYNDTYLDIGYSDSFDEIGERIGNGAFFFPVLTGEE